MESIADFVRKIVQSLVDQPELVTVEEKSGVNTCLLALRVAENDVGKVIGKQGRNVGAIRVLIGAVSAKQGKQVLLEVLE